VRGKSDKIDASRIAAYGYQKKTTFLQNPPPARNSKDHSYLCNQGTFGKTKGWLINAVKRIQEYRPVAK
jgi:hypothetical protein